MRALSIFLSLACVFSIFTASKALSSTEPLVIGIDADLSAVAVEGGIAITRGVELAVDEINAAGGILGRQIKVIAKDHRGNPAQVYITLSNFPKLPIYLR